MKRYIYYLFLCNVLYNLISAVPKILLEEREGGAIWAMIISPFLGIIVTIGVIGFFHRFPGQGLPEIMKKYAPKWLTFITLSVIILIWFTAGLLSLATFVFMLQRFLTPETPLTYMTVVFLLFATFGVLMESKKVLYTIEIILIIFLPFTLLLYFKAIISPELNIDFIREAIMHMNHLPNYSSIAAALFIHLGIANLVIMNRVFKNGVTFQWRDYVFIILIGLSALMCSYFLTIGIVGFNNVGTVGYPVISTSDSLRMPLGIIERVLFVMLTIAMSQTFISILLHWHVVNELLKSQFKIKNFRWKMINFTLLAKIGVIWAICILFVNYINEQQLLQISYHFYSVIAPFFFIILFIFQFIKRRANV